MPDFTLPAGLSLRPQTSTDAGFLATLFNATHDYLRLIDGEADFVEEIIEMQFRAQREGYGQQFPNAMYFIVEYHHEPIGRVAVDFGHAEVRLIDVAFIQAARGRGYGTAVIRALQNAARKVAAPLTLTALRHDRPVVELYAKLGFVIAAQTEAHLLMAWSPVVSV